MIDFYDQASSVEWKEKGLLASTAVPRELEGRGNVDSWEMIPLCKGQMEMTLG